MVASLLHRVREGSGTGWTWALPPCCVSYYEGEAASCGDSEHPGKHGQDTAQGCSRYRTGSRVGHGDSERRTLLTANPDSVPSRKLARPRRFAATADSSALSSLYRTVSLGRAWSVGGH